MIVTTVSGTGCSVTVVGTTVRTDTENFTLLTGLTLTLAKAAVTCVFWLVCKLAETRVAGCDCVVLACVLVDGVAAFLFCARCWAVDGCFDWSWDAVDGWDLVVSEAVEGCDLVVSEAVDGCDLVLSDAVE